MSPLVIIGMAIIVGTAFATLLDRKAFGNWIWEKRR